MTSINSIANKPDNYGPRFIRTVQPDGVRCCGTIPKENPQVISSAQLARHIPAGMQRQCEDAARNLKEGGYYEGAFVLFRKALTGEKLSSFYADYEIHPDDVDKGRTLAASL